MTNRKHIKYMKPTTFLSMHKTIKEKKSSKYDMQLQTTTIHFEKHADSGHKTQCETKLELTR